MKAFLSAILLLLAANVASAKVYFDQYYSRALWIKPGVGEQIEVLYCSNLSLTGGSAVQNFRQLTQLASQRCQNISGSPVTLKSLVKAFKKVKSNWHVLQKITGSNAQFDEAILFRIANADSFYEFLQEDAQAYDANANIDAIRILPHVSKDDSVEEISFQTLYLTIEFLISGEDTDTLLNSTSRNQDQSTMSQESKVQLAQALLYGVLSGKGSINLLFQ